MILKEKIKKLPIRVHAGDHKLLEAEYNDSSIYDRYLIGENDSIDGDVLSRKVLSFTNSVIKLALCARHRLNNDDVKIKMDKVEETYEKVKLGLSNIKRVMLIKSETENETVYEYELYVNVSDKQLEIYRSINEEIKDALFYKYAASKIAGE